MKWRAITGDLLYHLRRKEGCTVCRIKLKSNEQAVQCNKCINMAQTIYIALQKYEKNALLLDWYV